MHLFTYGTLMIPSMMHAVTGRHFAFREATARGYARFRIRGATYPGLVARPGAATDGVLYLDVDAPSLARLDAFEGALYRRTRLNVVTPENDALSAEGYVVRYEYRHRLSTDAWHLDDFRRDHLATFVKSYQGFNTVKKHPE